MFGYSCNEDWAAAFSCGFQRTGYYMLGTEYNTVFISETMVFSVDQVVVRGALVILHNTDQTPRGILHLFRDNMLQHTALNHAVHNRRRMYCAWLRMRIKLNSNRFSVCVFVLGGNS